MIYLYRRCNWVYIHSGDRGNRQIGVVLYRMAWQIAFQHSFLILVSFWFGDVHVMGSKQVVPAGHGSNDCGFTDIAWSNFANTEWWSNMVRWDLTRWGYRQQCSLLSLMGITCVWSFLQFGKFDRLCIKARNKSSPGRILRFRLRPRVGLRH